MEALDLLQLVDLKIQGLSRTEIAQRLDIHPTRVWQLTQLPEFKKLWEGVVEHVMQEVRAKFAARASQAADVEHGLMLGSPNDRIKLDAAKDILDRAGYKPKEVVESVVSVRIDSGRLALIAESANLIRAGRAPRVVEDAREELALLSHESDSRTLKARKAFTHRSQLVHPDGGHTEGFGVSAERPLQDNDRLGGLPNMASG